MHRSPDEQSNDFDDLLGLVEIAKAGAPLVNSPIHGEEHWHQVAIVGLHLARLLDGVDPVAVVIFAAFHDCQRIDEYDDPGHGRRGADALRACAVSGEVAPSVATAIAACTLHDLGHVHFEDVTVGAAMDADRLLLSRVGVDPDPAFMSTEAAKAIARGDAPTPPLAAPIDWRQRWLDAIDISGPPRR